MWIIERRTTANHAEYGLIVACMGPLFVEMGLKMGQYRRLRASWGRRLGTKPPQRRLYRRLAPRGDFYVSWEGQRLEML